MNENTDDVTARLRNSLSGRGAAPDLSTDLVEGAPSRPAPHVVNTGQRLRAGGVATLAIAAVTAGALLVTAPHQQAPLFTAASDGGNAPAAAEDSASSDMRIANWVNYQYVAGDGLSSNGGNGTVYQLKRVGSAENVANAVADAFGVDGDVVKSSYFDPAYPTYVVGPEDGTAPTVSVTWSGTGDWWYSDSTAYPQITCEPIEGDEAMDRVCTDKAPTENLAPSKAEAKRLAADILAETGFDVDADDIRVTADEWQTTAAASLVVDGTQTALDWTVSWAPSGKISWAYGHSVKLVNKGTYGTVSEKDAVARIADGRWFGAAGPEFQGGVMTYANDLARAAELDAVAQDGDTPVESPAEEPSEEPSANPTDPTTEPGTEPAPDPSVEPGDPGVDPGTDPGLEPEPVPEETYVPVEPETVVVTVNDATSTLLLLWDSEGNAWLVPGIAFKNPEGWWNTVVSLVEGVIELPEPMQIEPFTLEGTVID